jgi:hypothetical protein
VIISVWHEPAEHDKFDDEHINGVVRSRVAAYMDSHDHNKDGPIWHPDSECQQYGAESFTDGMEVVASTTAKRIEHLVQTALSPSTFAGACAPPASQHAGGCRRRRCSAADPAGIRGSSATLGRSQEELRGPGRAL